MSKVAKHIAYFLNNRPLCFLSTVFGLRDLVVGLAFIFPSDWHRTVIFGNLNALGGAGLYGALLVLISIVVIVGAISDKTKLAQWGLRGLSWFWLFAAISYIESGNWVFALSNFLICCLPAGYISFYYKWTRIWEEPKQKWRAKHGLAPLRVKV